MITVQGTNSEGKAISYLIAEDEQGMEEFAVMNLKSVCRDLAKKFSPSLSMVLEHYEETLNKVYGWDWYDIEQLEIKALSEV